LHFFNFDPMPRLALFASGNGSNAQRIVEYVTGHPSVSVEIILCNHPGAYVLTRAENLGVPAILFDRETFYGTDYIPRLLADKRIDYLVLAGFLWLIPPAILQAFPGRIINIHPALLPKYGGKGMYGERVHRAVIEAGEVESGITIHLVNERYDEGKILFQARCPVEPGDTPESLAARVHALEYAHYAVEIEKWLTNDN